MAHRIVDENSLKTVADAIREKAGTSDSLVFPTGFAEAIAGIQAGGGGGCATGTMTFANRQTSAPYPGIVVTHNLGYTPSNALWFVESSESMSGSYLIGANKGVFEYISLTSYCMAKGDDSDTNKKNIQYYINPNNATTVFNSLKANEASIELFTANAYRTSCYFPAGSTVRWIVW